MLWQLVLRNLKVANGSSKIRNGLYLLTVELATNSLEISEVISDSDILNFKEQAAVRRFLLVIFIIKVNFLEELSPALISSINGLEPGAPLILNLYREGLQ